MTSYPPHPQMHIQLRHHRGQTRFDNEAPPEAQGVNGCTEGCVLWSQHLMGWEGAVGRGGRSLGS